MRRILVATGVYPPESGGPATYTRLLEEALPAQGIEVRVLPFSVVRRWPRLFRHVVYAYKLVVMARGVQCIFAQDTVSVGLPAVMVARLLQKPFLVRVPGDYAWEQARQRWGVTDTIDRFQKNKYGWRTEIVRTVQRYVVQHAVYVVTPSNYFKSIVSTWGVAPERLKVIYNGIDRAAVEGPAQEPPHPYMVSVGRMVPWKGFDGLIRLVADMPEWRLVLVGDGPERTKLERLAMQKGVTARVYFTGALARTKTLGWCAAADAFVLNTSFESFSYQIIEAMSVGAAIVTTRIGSIPELVQDGIEGVLIAPDDLPAFRAALGTVVSEKEVWNNRRRAAQKKSERFAVSRTIEELTALLNTI